MWDILKTRGRPQAPPCPRPLGQACSPPGTHRERQDAIPSPGNGLYLGLFQGVISVPHHEICHITHFPVFALAISRSPQLTECNSISTGALDNKIKCLSFAVFFFWGNPTTKTVTGTAYTWELLIANHLDQSLWSTNQKYWAAVRSNVLHSFLEMNNCAAPFTGHGKLYKFGAEKPISWAKPAQFDFFTINVRSHILSQGGDALTLCVGNGRIDLHYLLTYLRMLP